MEATKNVCCIKGESAVDHNKVTRWFKKFCSGFKNLNNQATDSEVMLQAIKANLMSSASHSPVWFINSMTSAKVSGAAKFCHTLLKYCKTFDSSINRFYWFVYIILELKWLKNTCYKDLPHLVRLYPQVSPCSQEQSKQRNSCAGIEIFFFFFTGQNKLNYYKQQI